MKLELELDALDSSFSGEMTGEKRHKIDRRLTDFVIKNGEFLFSIGGMENILMYQN